VRRSFALVAVFVISSSAHAGSPRELRDAIQVREDACVTREAIVRGVAFWLQGSSPELDAVDVSVTVDGDVVAFVTRRRGSVAGERTIRAVGTCQERVDAVALAVALTIDATALDRVGVVDRATETPPPAPPVTLVIRAPRAREPAAKQGAARWTIDARAIALLDVLPGWAGGGELGAGVELGKRADLHATAGAAGGAHATLGTGAVDAQLAYGRFDACVRSTGDAWLSACAGTSAGAAFARGSGFVPSASTVLPWWAFGVRLGASFAFGAAWRAQFAVDWFVSVLRPTFDVTAGSTVAASVSMPPMGLGVSLGVGWRAP
jgi:hypothetical protein